MGFKNNYSQAEEFSGIKPEGFYEVMIVGAEEKETKREPIKQYLNLRLVIRNDVDQKYQNGYIFHTFWKEDEPTANDLMVNGYRFGRIMALGRAVGLPDGKEYSGLAEFLADLINKPVRLKLRHWKKKDGTVQEQVDYFMPTNFATVRHVMKKNVDVAADDYAKPAASYAAKPADDGFKPLPLDDDIPF